MVRSTLPTVTEINSQKELDEENISTAPGRYKKNVKNSEIWYKSEINNGRLIIYQLHYQR